MNEKSLRERVIRFVQAYHKRRGSPPSMKRICDELNTYAQKVYQAFPERMAGICRDAGIPVPKDRIQRTRKAQRKRARRAERARKKEARKILTGERTPVEDEEITRLRGEVEEIESRGLRAKKILEFQERKRRATREALEMEVALDPGKIPAYLETNRAGRALLEDLRALSKRTGRTIPEICKEAVKNFGNYEEWRARGGGGEVGEYVRLCLQEYFLGQPALKPTLLVRHLAKTTSQLLYALAWLRETTGETVDEFLAEMLEHWQLEYYRGLAELDRDLAWEAMQQVGIFMANSMAEIAKKMEEGKWKPDEKPLYKRIWTEGWIPFLEETYPEKWARRLAKWTRDRHWR